MLDDPFGVMDEATLKDAGSIFTWCNKILSGSLFWVNDLICFQILSNNKIVKKYCIDIVYV